MLACIQLLSRLDSLSAEKQTVEQTIEQEHHSKERLEQRLVQVRLQHLNAISQRCPTRQAQVIKEKEKVEQELEAEQEFLVNKLTKQNRAAVAAKENAERRLAALKSERDQIAAEAAAAQVACSSLREKLSGAQSEKVALERRLENEQEYITVRLNRQLAAVRAEKDKLQTAQHAEAESLLAAISASIQRLRTETSTPSPHHSSPGPAGSPTDSDLPSDLAVLSRLEQELALIQKRFTRRSAEHIAEASASAKHDAELQRLRTENWLLKQRISASEETRAQMTEQVAATTFADEIDSERAFNMGTTSSQEGIVHRSRAPSMDCTPPLSMHAPPHHGASDTGGGSHAASHRHSQSYGSEGLGNLDNLAAIARGLSGGPSGPLASPAPSSDAELIEDDEDSRFLRSSRNAHHVYPAEWSSPSPVVGRARAASSSSEGGCMRLPLPPPPSAATGAVQQQQHQLDMDAMLEGFPHGAASDRWRRSLGVEEDVGQGVEGGAAGAAARQVQGTERIMGIGGAGNLSSSAASGDTSSVGGSVSGLSSVSDVDKASAALVETGVEAIKAAMRRSDQ